MATLTLGHRFKLPFKEIWIVWWSDAYVTIRKNPKFNNNKKHRTISVGVKVDEDTEYIYLSNFYDGIEKKMDSPYTAIPKGMIKHVEKICRS